jgi:hypothetical protein
MTKMNINRDASWLTSGSNVYYCPIDERNRETPALFCPETRRHRVDRWRSFLNINSVRAVLGGLYVDALTKSLRRSKYSTIVGVPGVSVFAGLGID